VGDENLKDFTTNLIVGGLLMFCLLVFAINFMYNNNSSALNDGTGEIFDSNYDDFSDKLIGSSQDSNSLLNITSNTNPEVSDLGSRDSVAVSFGAKGSATSYWESSKMLLSWVFSGETKKILLGTFGGLIGFLSMFHIWRFIRNGL
jgi:hypothetical protein